MRQQGWRGVPSVPPRSPPGRSQTLLAFSKLYLRLLVLSGTRTDLADPALQLPTAKTLM